MATLDLVNDKKQIIFGDDSIVIQKYISGIKGGRVLDTTGFTESVIKAGHVIITDGKGVYKPMPISGGNYGTLPEGFDYAGVLYRSILTSRPSASIMTWGEVNSVAMPYAMDSILTAFQTACPHIDFIKDEEA